MRWLARFCCIVFCVALLVPVNAQGARFFTFQGPPAETPIYVGATFNVVVSLTVNGANPEPLIPTNVCAYNYCVDYDQSMIRLDPVDIVNNPPIPPYPLGIDAEFFGRTNPPYPPDCTMEYMPSGINCHDPMATCELPGPANIFFEDATGFAVGDPPIRPCATPVPVTRNVSILTFQALKAGCFSFSQHPLCPTFLQGCDATPEDSDEAQYSAAIVSNQICILSRPGIPAFTDYGIGFFALVIIGSFFLMVRRSGRNRHILPTLLLLLVFAMAMGFSAASADAQQPCPQYCKEANLDINQDGMLNVADTTLLMKCVKSNCGNLAYDVNRDNQVNDLDLTMMMECKQQGCSCLNFK